MRAVLKLEFIAENYFSYKRTAKNKLDGMERYGELLGRNKSRPWVACVVGFEEGIPFPKPIREFLKGQIDYSQASKNGSRGVFIYYALKPGIYEVNARETWTRVRRYFVHVEGMEITEISREEAVRCLQKSA